MVVPCPRTDRSSSPAGGDGDDVVRGSTSVGLRRSKPVRVVIAVLALITASAALTGCEGFDYVAGDDVMYSRGDLTGTARGDWHQAFTWLNAVTELDAVPLPSYGGGPFLVGIDAEYAPAAGSTMIPAAVLCDRLGLRDAKVFFPYTGDPVKLWPGQSVVFSYRVTYQVYSVQGMVRVVDTSKPFHGELRVPLAIEWAHDPLSSLNTGETPGPANDPEQKALATLDAHVASDHDVVVATLLGHVTTILSTKHYGAQNGLSWTYEDILSQYGDLRMQYPKAVLVRGSDFASLGSHDTDYVVLSGEVFDDQGAAQRWCDDRGLGCDLCQPRELS